MNRIKEARKAINMTQDELGKALGVIRQTISTYEKGTSEPKEGDWEIISKLTGFSVSYLKGDLSESEIEAVKIDERKNKDESSNRLGNILSSRKIPKEVMTAVIKIISNNPDNVEDLATILEHVSEF